MYGIFVLQNAALDDSDALEDTVAWGLKLLCVSRYLGYHSAHQVEDCVLTALAEMSPTKQKATLLAQGFPPSDFEGRNDAIGSKFARILTQLRAQSVENGVDTDGDTSSKDPLSVVYIMRSKSLSSARQALSLPLHSPDAHTQKVLVCESEFDEEYLRFLIDAAEHTSAMHVTCASSLHQARVHPFPAADTPLLSEFCIWTESKQDSSQPSLEGTITGSRVKPSLPEAPSTPTDDLLWPQLFPVARFLMQWSDLTLSIASDINEGPVKSSVKVSLLLETLCSALHIREMKALGVGGNVSQGTGGDVHHQDWAVTKERPLFEQKQQSTSTEAQEQLREEPFGGGCSHVETGNGSVMPAAPKPLLLTIPQEDFTVSLPQTFCT